MRGVKKDTQHQRIGKHAFVSSGESLDNLLMSTKYIELLFYQHSLKQSVNSGL